MYRGAVVGSTGLISLASTAADSSFETVEGLGPPSPKRERSDWLVMTSPFVKQMQAC